MDDVTNQTTENQNEEIMALNEGGDDSLLESGEAVVELVDPSEQQIDLDTANSLIAIEGLISGHLNRIQALQEDLNRYGEMLTSILENNPAYSEAVEKSKEMAKAKTQAKKEALKNPQAADLENKLKDLKGQMKDLRGALSDYLVQYRLLSGSDTLEDENGEVRQIVSSAKLVKRS